MLHAHITKKVNFINSGHVEHGPLGRDCRKKNYPPLMMWEKTVFDSTIGVPFRKKQKNPYGLHVQVSRCGCRTT